ncbi:disease resistance protein RGA2-like [Salvia miltiorrhiza]|uniref:disease resistance protein RGA2-like n=1 Tax=Salvia miltiorrhiza TaxID=226208 RepID=UPI0025AB8049|nr:disease resistance protein RGA2-like [Salvia miltiorrhiza]
MAKYLRTLVILFEVDISGINFSDFESLHVLRLDDGVEELSSSIRKFIHLRYFDISNTGIKYLPDWIGEFSHLQTLRVDAPYLRKLPSTIKYLINFRHLYINEDVELPMGIGRLTSLQTLKYFPVGDEDGCKIEELGSLKNLEGELEIRNLERVRDKEEAGKANLFKKSKILKLCLEWGEDREGERNDENVLEGLQPHSDLRVLEIWGFKGKTFPLWTQKMAVGDVVLNKLMSLSLIDCRECDEIPMLGHLPNLKSLLLKGLRDLKCINSSFYGMVNNDTRIVFPALESFQLNSMPKLAEWAEIEVSGASEVKLFPRLQHLEIYDCEQLMSVPSHVSSCLEYLKINGTGLECLPADWLFCNNETLSTLDVIDCSNLRELGDSCGEQSQGSFTSLCRLQIDECEALEYLPCEMLGFSLENLSLKSLSSLKNLARVYSLTLKGMESWECLPESIQLLTALFKLSLHDFGMEELPEWFGNLSSLNWLDLYNCKRLRRLPSVDAMRRLTTLEQLEIWDCPELVIQSEAVDSEWPKVSPYPLHPN